MKTQSIPEILGEFDIKWHSCNCEDGGWEYGACSAEIGKDVIMVDGHSGAKEDIKQFIKEKLQQKDEEWKRVLREVEKLIKISTNEHQCESCGLDKYDCGCYKYNQALRDVLDIIKKQQ